MMGPLALRRAVDAATRRAPANSYPLLVFSYADLADVCDATLCLLTGAAGSGGRARDRSGVGGGGASGEGAANGNGRGRRSPSLGRRASSPSLNESTNVNSRGRGGATTRSFPDDGASAAAADRHQCVLLFVPRVCAAGAFQFQPPKSTSEWKHAQAWPNSQLNESSMRASSPLPAWPSHTTSRPATRNFLTLV